MVSYKALNTFIESKSAYGCDAVGDGHRCQSPAAIESLIPDGCYAVGNRYGRHVYAITESRLTD